MSRWTTGKDLPDCFSANLGVGQKISARHDARFLAPGNCKMKILQASVLSCWSKDWISPLTRCCVLHLNINPVSISVRSVLSVYVTFWLSVCLVHIFCTDMGKEFEEKMQRIARGGRMLINYLQNCLFWHSPLMRPTSCDRSASFCVDTLLTLTSKTFKVVLTVLSNTV